MSRVRVALAAAVVVLIPFLVPAAAHAAGVSVTLAPALGPVTTSTLVTGSGFGANEAVDVYGGTTDIALVVSNATGAVSTRIRIPADAAPGAYWLTLVGRHSGVAAQAAFTVHADVTQGGGDAGQHLSNAYENELGPSHADDLDLAWNVATTGYQSVAVARGVVYQATTTTVVARDEVTGAARWTATLPCDPVGTPAFATNVYIGCDDGSVVALQLSSGHVLWRYQQPTTSTMSKSVQALGALVYGTTDAGSVFAVRSGGTLAWSSSQGVVQGFAGTGSQVYVSTGTSSVYSVTALNATTGAVVWTESLGSGSGRTLDVVAGPEGVFASFRADGYVYRLDETSGNFIDVDFTPYTFATTLALLGRRLYAVTTNRTLVALSSTDTTVQWQSSATVADPVPPFVADGVVWVGGVGFSAASGGLLTQLNNGASAAVTVTDGELFEPLSGHLSVFALPAIQPARRPDPAALGA